MAFLQVQFFSKALRVASTVNVILPEAEMGIGVNAAAQAGPAKVLWLLHGYSDDHSIWMRRTSVERYAAGLNLAVVMPAVNHSFYTNEVHGERYFDYVAEELPAAMRGFFRISDRPEDNFVAGLSMGGYGAMKLALTFPERYAAAGCFSGALDIADMSGRTKESLANMARVFGDPDAVAGSENDLLYLLKKNAGAPVKPRLWISCGKKDFLYQQHKKVVRALKDAGWDLTHDEVPGYAHEWSFWDREIARFIPWALGEK